MTNGKLIIIFFVLITVVSMVGFFAFYQPLQKQIIELENEKILLEHKLEKRLKEASASLEKSESDREQAIRVCTSQYNTISDEYKELQKQKLITDASIEDLRQGLNTCDSDRKLIQSGLQSQLNQTLTDLQKCRTSTSPVNECETQTHASEVEKNQNKKIQEFLTSRLRDYRETNKSIDSSYPWTNGKYRHEDLLISVITSPKFHETRAIAIKESWAKRAHQVLFISSAAEHGLPTYVVPDSEASGSLAANKVFGALAEMHDTYLNEYKWFMKVDDDTFPLIPNILEALEKFDYNKPLYLGRLGGQVGNLFCSGGAGYILSRESLKQIRPHLENCSQIGPEDMELAKCLKTSIGLEPTEVWGFYAWTPSYHIATNSINRKVKPLSFHSIYVGEMLEMDYLLYGVDKSKN